MMTFYTKNIVKVLGVFGLLILSYLSAYTQNKYFVKDYSWVHTHEAFDIVQVGNNYVIAGGAIDSNLINWQAFNIVIDETGEIRKLTYDDDSSWYTLFHEMYCEDNVCYSVGGKVQEALTGPDKGYGLINSLENLDNNFVDIEAYPDSIEFQTITKSGGKFYAGGSAMILVDSIITFQLYIAELDEDLQVVNSFSFYDDGFFNIVENLQPAPNGGLYVAADMSFYSPFTDDSYVKFMHLDSLGNILVEQDYNLTDKSDVINEMTVMDNGNIVLVVTTRYYDLNEYESTVMVITPEGEILESYFFIDEFIEKVLCFENGDFLTISTYSDLDAKGKIQRFDASGEVLWDRIYDGPIHQYLRNGLFQNGDKTGQSGYVICGRNDTLSPPGEFWATASMWLLKLNCLGYPNDPKIAFDYSIVDNTVSFNNKSEYLYLDEPIDAGALSIDFGNGSVYEVMEDTDSLIVYEYQEPGYYNITFTGRVCNDSLVVSEVICVGVSAPELNVDFEYEVISQENFMEVICTRTAADIDEWGGIYSWDFGDGVILETNDSVVSHQYYEGDSISIKLTSSPICQESFSKSKTISLLCETLDYSLVELDFTIETFFYGDSTLAVFTNTSTYPEGLLNTFTWNFGDGNNLTTEADVVEHIYYEEDTLVSSLFSEEVCNNVFIHIEDFTIETGIGQIDFLPFAIYPNPTQDHVKLILAEAVRSEIAIFDIYGKMVYSNSFNNQIIRIDVSALSDGMYFIKGSLDNRFLETQKMMIVRSEK